MATLGDTTAYTSNSTCNTTANMGEGTLTTAAEDGTATSITAYMNVVGSRGSHSGKKFRYAMYHWSGSQWDLMELSAEHTVSLLEAYPLWVTENLLTSQSIVNGEKYGFAVLGETVTAGTMAVRISSSDLGDDVRFDATTYATGFGDPFSVDASSARNMSIYCTYTAGASTKLKDPIRFGGVVPFTR